jgi:hypothetical protein
MFSVGMNASSPAAPTDPTLSTVVLSWQFSYLPPHFPSPLPSFVCTIFICRPLLVSEWISVLAAMSSRPSIARVVSALYNPSTRTSLMFPCVGLLFSPFSFNQFLLLLCVYSIVNHPSIQHYVLSNCTSTSSPYLTPPKELKTFSSAALSGPRYAGHSPPADQLDARLHFI